MIKIIERVKKGRNVRSTQNSMDFLNSSEEIKGICHICKVKRKHLKDYFRKKSDVSLKFEQVFLFRSLGY